MVLLPKRKKVGGGSEDYILKGGKEHLAKKRPGRKKKYSSVAKGQDE